jgi:hypothetical protein
LAGDMYEDGYNNIISIDFSQEANYLLESKYQKYSSLKCKFMLIILVLSMDVRQMTFKNGEFNSIIDKATFDSVLVNYNLN